MTKRDNGNNNMNIGLFAKGALCIALAWSSEALATATPIVYDFSNSANITATGYNPYNDPNQSQLTYGNLVGTGGTAANEYQNGSMWGNALTVKSGTSSVVVRAYAGTGSGGGNAGTIQNALVTQYNVTNGSALAVTSRDLNNGASTDEFSCSARTAATVCGPNIPEHAMDNSGAYESLLFSFSKATKLTGVTIGYPTDTNSPDSDATVLYYKGTKAPVIIGQTYAQLVGTYNATNNTGGWVLAGNLFNLGTSPNYTGNITSGASAQYWMVGAYIAAVQSSTPSLADSNPDYIKIHSLTTSSVPEPGTMALLGVAGAALFARRRRTAGAR